MHAAIAGWLAAKAGPHLHVGVLVDRGGNRLFGESEEGRAATSTGSVARGPGIRTSKGLAAAPPWHTSAPASSSSSLARLPGTAAPSGIPGAVSPG